jgi:transposase
MENLLNDSVEALNALIEQLKSDLSKTLEENERLQELKSELAEENERLRHQLNQLLQDKFGTKSEKGKNLADQAFDESKTPDNEPEIKSAEQEISIAAHKRKKGGKPGRRPLPEHLPRIQQIYDLKDSEKVCACGCLLTRIGEDTSEQLDIIPATVQVIQHIKYKYACPGCEATIKTSPGPKWPLPKSIASPGLLAHVIVSKFKDHLPLYRQENIFQRMGVDIPRNTLSLWVIKTAQQLLPLYKLEQDIMVDYDVG